MIIKSAHQDNWESKYMLKFQNIATSLRMFITLSIYLSNQASCIYIDYHMRRYLCHDHKNKRNLKIGTPLSVAGEQNEQKCLLRYCLLRYRLLRLMHFIYQCYYEVCKIMLVISAWQHYFSKMVKYNWSFLLELLS